MLSVESEYVLKTVTLCTCTVGTEADFVVCSQLQRYRWKMNKMLEYSYINSLKVHWCTSGTSEWKSVMEILLISDILWMVFHHCSHLGLS